MSDPKPPAVPGAASVAAASTVPLADLVDGLVRAVVSATIAVAAGEASFDLTTSTQPEIRRRLAATAGILCDLRQALVDFSADRASRHYITALARVDDVESLLFGTHRPDPTPSSVTA